MPQEIQMTPRAFLRVLILASAGTALVAGCTPPPQQQPTQVAAVDQSWPDRDERLSTRERREVQRLLRSLGYEPGGIDGVVGARTREAISDYQAATRRRADGVVSSELLASLRADAGVRAPVVAEPRRTTEPRPATTTRRTPPPATATTRTEPAPPPAQTAPAPAPAPAPTFVRREHVGGESDADSGGWN
jgi:peptidoglycan hydrolase-like protein with peptidoglycan-binding domain